METREFDAIVVGGGLSGLRCALELSEKWNVAVISKVVPIRSHSNAAQGGINAALGNHPDSHDDSPKRHAFDTVKGADYLADQDVVMFMCEEAPKIVIEYESMGAPFSRFEDGKIAQRPFGGAGYPRACYAGDRTGHALLHTLYEQCTRKGVKFFEEYFLIDLIKVNERITGLIAMDIASGELEIFRSPYVVLATGGFGRIYKRSTNSVINTGDGNGASFRIGVPMQDCEFVQFHPTTLFGSNILITEGARGEGAYLYNNKHERFMIKIAPEAKELAPRDIVARAIDQEVRDGRGYEDEYVLLDMTHLGAEKIKNRLPGIREISMYFANLDPIEVPIPVQPGQHYSMGGIATKLNGDYGESIIEGLYSIGECSCLSVHGANRLGGNSLLETAVFGRYLGRTLLKKGVPSFAISDEIKSEEQKTLKNTEDMFKKWNNNTGKKPAEIRLKMGGILNDKVGVFRNQHDLESAYNEIKGLQHEFLDTHISTEDRCFNYGLIRTLELRNMLDIGEVTAFAAMMRKESRGAHSRTDFPKRNDKDYLYHSLVYRTKDGLELKTKPVKLGIFEVKERSY